MSVQRRPKADDESSPRKGPATGVRVSTHRSLLVEGFQRLLIAALCFGVGYASWGQGRSIIRTGEYSYVLETSNGSRGAPARRQSNFIREEVHATGDWAREQAFGFMAAGLTVAYWGCLIVLGSIGPFTNPLVWSPLRTAMTALSFAGCTASVLAFFPPWRIGSSMSANAFYLVLAASAYLATIRDPRHLKAQSQKVFPALIASAAIVGSFSSGYGVGIITGIFICLLLAFHVVMLIPKVRAELLRGANRYR
ncbi:hypothetical protein [Planctomyces sp. SH-PL62]|uniref:hypothetical protein n=1 Tax=Planctomyces sp. SH-PL62 TaxID=1636152 RepID=UPI0012E7FF85|nr:hypothetical protein [Planctomyces sp. SH-PL62]